MMTLRLAMAAIGAASGVLLFGAVPADAVDRPNGRKVGVCHRTASDSNPYTFIRVDRNSTQYEGHLAHRNDPSKWKKGRRDYIGGLDGRIRSLKDCPNGGKPTPEPPKPIPPGQLGPGQKPPKGGGAGICRSGTATHLC